MKNFFLKRLLVYPGAFAILWYYIFENYATYSALDLIRKQITILTEIVPLAPPFDVILYGILFGYVYGTSSVLISVRKLRSFILIAILFFAKVVYSGILAVTIGYLIFPIEIILLPVIVLCYKAYKRKKKFKAFNTHSQRDLYQESK